MNIAHIVFGLSIGGIETMLANIAAEQVNQSHNVAIFVINDLIDNDFLSTIDGRIAIFKINRPLGSKNPIYFFKLNILLHRFKPDVVHVHKAKIYNYLFPKFRNITCVTQHEIIVPDDFAAIRRIRHKFSISHSVANDLQARLGIESTVVYNGIYTECFEHKKKLKDDLFKCVCVGRLKHEIKGQDVLIKAISKLSKKTLSRIKVDIIGEGDSREYLQQIINDFKLSETVSLTGLKSQQWIFDNLGDYDLFIAPSIFEGFGLTIVEAMCASVPVLVSDIQGPMEIIKNGDYGYYFKCSDSKDCAAKLTNIVDHGVENGLIDRARNHALANFDIRITANKYLKEYEQIKGSDSQ